jgi:hypothetical protein
MGDMTTEQILWGVNTFLLACLVGLIGILYSTIRGDIKEVRADIEKRTLLVTCDKIHADVLKSLHVHATTGAAGEAVYK